MRTWLPTIGWRDLAPDEALELGLEQVSRWRWQLFEIVWLNYGLGLCVRALPR